MNRLEWENISWNIADLNDALFDGELTDTG